MGPGMSSGRGASPWRPACPSCSRAPGSGPPSPPCRAGSRWRRRRCAARYGKAALPTAWMTSRGGVAELAMQAGADEVDPGPAHRRAVRARLPQRLGVPAVHAGAEVEGLANELGLLVQGEVDDELLVASQRPEQRRGALVGPTHDEDAVADLAGQDPHRLEDLAHRDAWSTGPAPRGRATRSSPPARTWAHDVRRLVVGVLGLAAARLRLGDDAVLDEQDVVPEVPPVAELRLGHASRRPAALRRAAGRRGERRAGSCAGRPGPVRDPVVDRRHHPFERGHGHRAATMPYIRVLPSVQGDGSCRAGCHATQGPRGCAIVCPIRRPCQRAAGPASEGAPRQAPSGQAVPVTRAAAGLWRDAIVDDRLEGSQHRRDGLVAPDVATDRGAAGTGAHDPVHEREGGHEGVGPRTARRDDRHRALADHLAIGLDVAAVGHLDDVDAHLVGAAHGPGDVLRLERDRRAVTEDTGIDVADDRQVEPGSVADHLRDGAEVARLGRAAHERDDRDGVRPEADGVPRGGHLVEREVVDPHERALDDERHEPRVARPDMGGRPLCIVMASGPPATSASTVAATSRQARGHGVPVADEVVDRDRAEAGRVREQAVSRASLPAPCREIRWPRVASSRSGMWCRWRGATIVPHRGRPRSLRAGPVDARRPAVPGHQADDGLLVAVRAVDERDDRSTAAVAISTDGIRSVVNGGTVKPAMGRSSKPVTDMSGGPRCPPRGRRTAHRPP